MNLTFSEIKYGHLKIVDARIECTYDTALTCNPDNQFPMRQLTSDSHCELVKRTRCPSPRQLERQGSEDGDGDDGDDDKGRRGGHEVRVLPPRLRFNRRFEEEVEWNIN